MMIIAVLRAWHAEPVAACGQQKSRPDRAAFCFDRVELVGFEPTSKQGNHTLSTRLFWPSVFVLQQDPDHQLQPYPLKLHQCGGAHTGYFRFTCTALPSDSEQHPWSSVSFCHLVTE